MEGDLDPGRAVEYSYGGIRGTHTGYGHMGFITLIHVTGRATYMLIGRNDINVIGIRELWTFCQRVGRHLYRTRAKTPTKSMLHVGITRAICIGVGRERERTSRT